MRPSYRTLLLIATGLTLAYLLGIAFNISPWLRGPEEWRWPYVIPGSLSRAWLSAVLLLGYLLIVALLTRAAPPRRRTGLILLAAGLMTPLLQIGLLYLDHADFGLSQLFNRTVSELSGGFYNVGVPVIDNVDFLTHFVERMPSYPVHPQRHPPGLPLLFAWARQAFERIPTLASAMSGLLRSYQCHNLSLMNLPDSAIAAAVIQMLVPIWLGLLVIPLYLFGRRVYDHTTAQRAVLLWPLLPSVALWATRWNQVYSLFTLLAFIVFIGGLRGRRVWLMFVAGLIVATAMFFSLGNLVIVGFLGLYAAVWLLEQEERPTIAWLSAAAGLFIAGMALFWLFLWLAYDLNPVAMWNTAMRTHLGLGRSYVTWLFYHPYDFLVFFGIAPTVFWVARFVRASLQWRIRPRDILVLSFGLGLVLLTLSGTSQGEVARVWAFLLPLALLTAVPREHGNRRVFIGIAALLALQVFVGNLFLQPVSTGLIEPPRPPQDVAAQGAPLAVWENGIALQTASFSVTAAPGDKVTVQMVWGTDRPINRPYSIFVHLQSEDGRLVTQADGLPHGGKWLTTCWLPGRFAEDVKVIELPESLPTGSYVIRSGLYWLPTGERALLRGGGDDVELGIIQVK